MIVGGTVSGYDGILETEIFDIQSNINVTSSFGDIQSGRRDAVGGLIGTTPILCGGYKFPVEYADEYPDEYPDDPDDLVYDSCLTLKDSKWTQTHQMTTKRANAASVQINSSTLWILGGHSGDNNNKALSTSEFVRFDSTVGIPGPPLPYGVKEFCAVKYSTDKIFVIGGYGYSSTGRWSNGVLKKVLIFNPNNFNYTEGPNLITPRYGHTCARRA